MDNTNKKYTHKEIYENRLTWIMYLKTDSIEKTTKILEDSNNSNARCCLGHGCHILDIPRSIFTDIIGNWVEYGFDNEAKRDVTAPDSLIAKTSLNSKVGNLLTPFRFVDINSNKSKRITLVRNLVELNDDTEATPLQIGSFLHKNIMGRGKYSPWKRIRVSNADKKIIEKRVIKLSKTW